MAYINTAYPNGSAPTRGRHTAGAGWQAGPRRPTWPLVADDLFRLAHRDHDGRPLLDEHVTGLGLAAALLAELVLAKRLALPGGQVMIVDTEPPIDALAHTVLDRLAAERAALPVRTWLAYLARTAHQDVAERLSRAGHLRKTTERRLLGRRVRYVPTDMNTAAWPWARLSGRLQKGQPLDGFDTLLGGLILATDLYRTVLLGHAADLETGLRAAVTTAPAPVRELLAHTEAAVGDAIITRR
ncbi:GOLPH3/VPS74 family protein [Actinoplanes flavus]|uniref:GPP34 family phosphoprotein n=1 Tax=Actinoplanes flavus TaxID=2820290 RepID=A0ABS3USS6_9ACTN|nr:GPP34 family phosphoprotein [Actinoplanes flavus]MBO3741630.1 GPP34 family phosphoprotein [Actinoplanes flavus]